MTKVKTTITIDIDDVFELLKNRFAYGDGVDHRVNVNVVPIYNRVDLPDVVGFELEYTVDKLI